MVSLLLTRRIIPIIRWVMLSKCKAKRSEENYENCSIRTWTWTATIEDDDVVSLISVNFSNDVHVWFMLLMLSHHDKVARWEKGYTKEQHEACLKGCDDGILSGFRLGSSLDQIIIIVVVNASSEISFERLDARYNGGCVVLMIAFVVLLGASCESRHNVLKIFDKLLKFPWRLFQK